jgi:Stage II sporulation protein E (SpoIIE)
MSIDINNIQLTEFNTTAIKSERTRLIWMTVAFCFFLLLGFFRIISPLPEAPHAGWLITALATPYIIYEVLVRSHLSKCLKTSSSPNKIITRFTPLVECSFPIIGISLMLLFTSYNPYSLLVSSGYAMIFIILALSPLQLDPLRSIFTGLLGTLGYAALVIYVITTADAPGPYPNAMLVSLTIMLAIATIAVTFVTVEIRKYVFGTIRELETRRLNEQLNKDMGIARDIQRGLLPQTKPTLPGYQIAAISRAADLAGGDYYDWQPISDNRMIISLADVTGHGVGPALVTAACRAYVRALVSHHPELHNVMDRINNLLHSDLSDGRFVTFAMLDIDVDTHQAIFLSAGHGPTMLMNAEDGSTDSYNAQGMPLGIFDNQELDQAIRFSFKPGDVFVIFSDGFFETHNTEGELFGVARLEKIIRENRHKSADEILDQMDKSIALWQGDQPQQDDITGIVIKRNAQ